MMIIKQTLRALALVCAIGTCGGPASAQVGPKQVVLFDNFGPGNSYNPDAGVPFGGSLSGSQVEEAMAFTAFDNYLLTAGEFGVTLVFDLSPVVAPFEIAVHADEGGLPGAVLELVTVREDLGEFGVLNPPVVVEFAGTTVLNAGEQYWISMSAEPGMLTVWNRNNEGDVGPRAFREDDGFWELASSTDQRGAFRLHGTLVPAPGAIGLLGLFACARGGRRRVG